MFGEDQDGVVVEQDTESQAAVEDNSGLPKDFMEALDVEAERLREVNEPPEVEAPKGDKVVDAAPDEDGIEDESKADEPGEATPEISSTLLERAVRAGLSLDDAEKFTDSEALERVTVTLEQTQSKDESPSEGGEADADAESKKLLYSVPTLGPDLYDAESRKLLSSIPTLDPDLYDEDVVAGFNAVRNVISKQQDVIAELYTQIKNGVAPKGSWVDGEIAKLGKDYSDVFGEGDTESLSDASQKAARSRLQRYIDFVREDAKSEGIAVDESRVFEQALQAAFGDKVKAVKGAATKAAAAKRSRQAVSRPRNDAGQFSEAIDAASMTDEQREEAAIKAVAAMMGD